MLTKTEAANGTSHPLPGDARECPIEKTSLNETPTSLNENDSSTPAALTHQQLSAIDLLAQGAAHRTVTRKLKIDPKTLYRWRQQPAFVDRLSQRRTELWSDVVQRLRGMAHESLDVLDEQLRDTYDRSRFQAATTVLKMLDLKKAAADLK